MLTEDARRARIATALAAFGQSRQERVRLPWRNGDETFDVVELPLEAVVLNPRSHRIRSQLESHPNAATIDRDPWSAGAQDIVAEVLRSTDDFDDLKTNLKESGQLEPGAVTRVGVLVNGNTRAVALRDLGVKFIRVAVLPDDAGLQELDDLELRLQMARDFKQAYTYTNELLFVDELIARHNLSPTQVAQALGWAASSESRELERGRARVQASTRQLALIREIQRAAGGTVPLTDFDLKKEVIKEVDERLQATADPISRERIKRARFLGIYLNLGYRELREVDDSFIRDYLTPVALEDETLAELLGTPPATERVGGLPSGLDELGVGSTPTAEYDPGRLLERLAQTARTPSKGLDLGGDQLLDALRTAMDRAAELARIDKKSSGKLTAPIEQVAQVNRKLSQLPALLGAALGQSGFDLVKFREELDKLGRHVEGLRARLPRDS